MVLLEARAATDSRDNEGRTVIFFAVVENRRNFVEMLMNAKANVNAPDENQRTYLFEAIQNQLLNMAKLLIQRRAGVRARAPCESRQGILAEMRVLGKELPEMRAFDQDP